jgi:hypothetical protein
VGEGSGGEEEAANEVESSCFRFFRETCGRRGCRSRARNALAAAFRALRSTGRPPRVIGSSVATLMEAFDLSWTTPSTPGIDGSIKSAATYSRRRSAQ